MGENAFKKARKAETKQRIFKGVLNVKVKKK